MNETINTSIITKHEGEADHGLEPLTDEELGNLIAAFGNHEAKALLLLEMRPGEYYGISALHALHVEAQGDAVAYEGDIQNQIGYCDQSLEPIGMVARSRVAETRQFGLTDYGVEIGQPIAALLLDFAAEHNLSLAALFGQTQTSSAGGRRSPLTRLKVMQSIVTRNGDVKVRDIVEDTDIASNAVVDALEAFQEVGLLVFDSVKTTVRNVTISLNKERAQQKSQRPGTFSELLMTTIKELDANGATNMDALVMSVSSRPGDHRELNTRALRDKINSTLKSFERQGLVTRDKVSRDEFSLIEIPDNSREVMEQLLNLLEGVKLLDPDLLAKGRVLKNTILSDLPKVRRLVHQAYEFSPQANRSERLTTKNKILRALEGSDEALDARQVRELLRAMGGKVLGLRQVSSLLTELSESDGLLVTVDKGNTNYYRVAPDSD